MRPASGVEPYNRHPGADRADRGAPSRFVDTHCHLDQLARPAAVLAEAAHAGVDRVVAVSESPASMLATLALKRRWPDRVVAGLGLHPVWITSTDERRIEEALRWLDAHLERARLVGEIGLDHKWATTPREQDRQRAFLDLQLDLAAAHGRPVALHSRRCLRETMERAIRFHEEHGLNAQLHWFTHSAKLIRRCNEAGIYVSVGPTVLGDPSVQSVVRHIDDRLLLLETDAPVPFGGRPAAPADTAAVAAALAGLTDASPEAIGRSTTANFDRFLAGR